MEIMHWYCVCSEVLFKKAANPASTFASELPSDVFSDEATPELMAASYQPNWSCFWIELEALEEAYTS